MWYFAGLLWNFELLEKLESEVEDLDQAEDGEASEEAHRAPNQTDQLLGNGKDLWANHKKIIKCLPDELAFCHFCPAQSRRREQCWNRWAPLAILFQFHCLG